MPDGPRILSPDDAAISAAVARLRAGGVVAFPTETVYGLGADTFNVGAIRRVYALKGRPWNNPLIAHVSGVAHARQLVSQWSEPCQRLADRFWPGPLTLVLPKAPDVPGEATAGLATIAVRCPRHDVARRLLQAFGGPLSAPSANPSGGVSPTRATHVAADFAGADLMILDGGSCEIGIESTVLEVGAERARILRPGSVTAEAIGAVIGEVESPSIAAQGASPGTSPAHYAPRTPTELVESRDLEGRLRSLTGPSAVLCFDAEAVVAPHHALPMPREPGEYAAALYQRLREADDLRLERIVIEKPPAEGDAWPAIHDRLRRATTR